MFNKIEPISIEENLKQCQEFLNQFGQLDKNLEEGLACRKKFNNNWSGVSKQLRSILDDLAKSIINSPKQYKNLSIESKLILVDTLTLASNHMDQQTLDAINPKPSKELKEATVLHWLTAAMQLLPSYSKDQLKTDNDNVRLLSSQSMVMFYYGKALRYGSKVNPEEQLDMFYKAKEIALFLEKNPNPCDLHQFTDRLPTIGAPIIHTLHHLKQFDNMLLAASDLLEIASKDPNETCELLKMSKTPKMIQVNGKLFYLNFETTELIEITKNIKNQSKFDTHHSELSKKCTDIAIQASKEEKIMLASLLNRQKDEYSMVMPHVFLATAYREKYLVNKNEDFMDKALINVKQARDIAVKIDHPRMKCNAWTELMNCYDVIGDGENALENAQFILNEKKGATEAHLKVANEIIKKYEESKSYSFN